MSFDLKDYFFVGFVSKVHGIKGELRVVFDVDNIKPYLKKKSYLLEKHGSLHAFSVQSIRLQPDNSCIVKFKELDSRNDAELWEKSSIYLPITELPKLTKDSQFYFHEIIDAKVFDETYGEVGSVKGVIEMPLQSLLKINHKGIEVLLPINDDTVPKFDRKEQTLFTRFPEGLLEVYTEK